MLKKNESKRDRQLRALLGTLLLLSAVATQVWWLLVPAVLVLFTAVSGFCSIYALFGFSTCPVNKDKTAA